jgi:hypothetical protein
MYPTIRCRRIFPQFPLEIFNMGSDPRFCSAAIYWVMNSPSNCSRAGLCRAEFDLCWIYFQLLSTATRISFASSRLHNFHFKINLAIPSIGVFPLEFLPSYHCLSNWYLPHRVCVPGSLTFSRLLSLTSVGVHASVICKFNLLCTPFLLSSSSDFLWAVQC